MLFSSSSMSSLSPSDVTFCGIILLPLVSRGDLSTLLIPSHLLHSLGAPGLEPAYLYATRVHEMCT